MKTPQGHIIAAVVLFLSVQLPGHAQQQRMVPLGNFEQWTVRNITESPILGGETKTIYNVAPNDTIDGNKAFLYKNTKWASSNAYAVVAGITKTSCNVVPGKGPSGRCARLETAYASCKVAGLININVLVQGTLIWGKMKEPITGISDPYSSMDWGIPFTDRPKAIVLDYKAFMKNSGQLTKGTTFKTQTFAGYDAAEVTLLLQNRWEDEQGNIHAKRVGTAVYHITKSSSGWVSKFRVPVIYGDATKDPGYKPYMDLLCNTRALQAVNSKGKSKVIHEEEWASADEKVTHAILIISSGSMGAYVGEIGNVLEVDNIMLEY